MTVSTVSKQLTEKKVVTFDMTKLYQSVVSVNKTSQRRASSINKNKRKHNDGSNVTYGRMELDSGV